MSEKRSRTNRKKCPTRKQIIEELFTPEALQNGRKESWPKFLKKWNLEGDENENKMKVFAEIDVINKEGNLISQAVTRHGQQVMEDPEVVKLVKELVGKRFSKLDPDFQELVIEACVGTNDGVRIGINKQILKNLGDGPV